MGNGSHPAWSLLTPAEASAKLIRTPHRLREHIREVPLARYRLRFLLQEIDLPQGATLIGRSVACHVTIEDPLVSRTHARIFIDGERATVEDLGSRNGLLVGGQPVQGVAELNDGARIRIGTQELVLARVADDGLLRKRSRITGFMTHCSKCGFPYPGELDSCPNCGSVERSDEDTLSGTSKEAWSFDLLVETVNRARALGRWQDVERVLQRARGMIEQIVASTEPVDRDKLDELASAAVALSVTKGQAEWGRWVLTIYACLGLVPPRTIGQSLSSLPPAERSTLAPAAGRVVQGMRSAATEEDGEALATLRLLASNGGGS